MVAVFGEFTGAIAQVSKEYIQLDAGDVYFLRGKMSTRSLDMPQHHGSFLSCCFTFNLLIACMLFLVSPVMSGTRYILLLAEQAANTTAAY